MSKLSTYSCWNNSFLRCCMIVDTDGMHHSFWERLFQAAGLVTENKWQPKLVEACRIMQFPFPYTTSNINWKMEYVNFRIYMLEQTFFKLAWKRQHFSIFRLQFRVKLQQNEQLWPPVLDVRRTLFESQQSKPGSRHRQTTQPITPLLFRTDTNNAECEPNTNASKK